MWTSQVYKAIFFWLKFYWFIQLYANSMPAVCTVLFWLCALIIERIDGIWILISETMSRQWQQQQQWFKDLKQTYRITYETNEKMKWKTLARPTYRKILSQHWFVLIIQYTTLCIRAIVGGTKYDQNTQCPDNFKLYSSWLLFYYIPFFVAQ